MDESPRQLISNTRLPLPVKPGHCEREDYEHMLVVACAIFFMAVEPLAGKRLVRVFQNERQKRLGKIPERNCKNYEYAEKDNFGNG